MNADETTAATASPAASEPLPSDVKVRIREVGKAYARRGQEPFTAIDTVSLDLKVGEFVSVVGPSGSGKSTLLRMLAGLDVPSSGYIELAHENGGRAATAVVFQEYSIFPWKTVLANVAFGVRMRGLSKRAAENRAREWIRKVGLEQFEQSYPATLSGGMKQRVAVARALALDPEVLLLDEPFAALDAQMRQVLQEELLAQWDENLVGGSGDGAGNRSAMLVTHSLEEAIFLGDSVVLMSASPGIIKARYEVPFGRPRDPSIKTSEEFARLHEEIWCELRDEVAAAAEQESAR